MDSWWYYKDSNGGGILNWTAPPSVFPDGVEYVAQNTNWKFQAHSKYFSQNTVYANNLNPVNNTLYNGSTFEFTKGGGNMALPLTLFIFISCCAC